MKKTIYRAGDRGHANHGWLDAHHSFSFTNYYDPSKIRFGVLRVLNDDIIQPGMGFGTHPHDNMEIVTIPLKGELAHKDSTGNKGVITPNEVQIMSAGSGLTHSEYNNSKTEPINLLQIWVFPKEKDIEPRYEQKLFNPEERKNKFKTIVSPEKKSDAMWINQDAYFSVGSLDAGHKIDYKIQNKKNGLYIFLIDGEIDVNGEKLTKRDAIGLEDIESVEIVSIENSEVLLIDLPMN